MNRVICAGVAALAGACTAGTDGGDTGTAFEGAWRYRSGSFSFVNCYTDSRSVDLGGTGFQIVGQGDGLVRVGTDGCRLTLRAAASTHASGLAGEMCTVQVTDPNGNPITTRYEVRSWAFELEPDAAAAMVEVFTVAARTTTNLGTITCEISGNNTLERVP